MLNVRVLPYVSVWQVAACRHEHVPPISGVPGAIPVKPAGGGRQPERDHRESSIAVHIRVNSGRVLAVVAMFSTDTSGTARPITAPAVAMRWSS
ncbi:hypothetical protein SAMN05421869_12616 [Nonomuraea jiangxiensis]|uniref:Uncharacterized protein n=1 Tax=Nonomuraea jiangxiensis TaxID=633440 RepID=A0A1G9K6Z4_9ACTN|nr:hypothetical protein SAMN05421869_12616 [Nonomuraea jiangxiensis]